MPFLSPEDAMTILHSLPSLFLSLCDSCRQDLESLRTIADQVRKREKFKKRQLVEWRQEWRLKIALARIKKKKKVLCGTCLCSCLICNI